MIVVTNFSQHIFYPFRLYLLTQKFYYIKYNSSFSVGLFAHELPSTYGHIIAHSELEQLN